MRSPYLLLLSLVVLAPQAAWAAGKAGVPVNSKAVPAGADASPLIDFEGFVSVAREAARHRQSRRIGEAEFLRMSREKGTIILDTRSAAAFKRRHVAGAVHLNFSDITKESLANVIPNKETRVLIYYNNNFAGDADAFPAKAIRAALNIPTFVTLYEYGYRNVYELKPLIDVKASKLPLTPQSTIESLLSPDKRSASSTSDAAQGRSA
ncbi:MAG: rhodanese-like domain-containing protein [Planctomycetota bacterium]